MIGLFNLLACKKVLVHLPQLKLYNSLEDGSARSAWEWLTLDAFL